MDVDPNILSAVLGCLLVISEAIGLSSKLKESSISQLIFTFASKLFKRD